MIQRCLDYNELFTYVSTQSSLIVDELFGRFVLLQASEETNDVGIIAVKLITRTVETEDDSTTGGGFL